jgi:hypothetical protein
MSQYKISKARLAQIIKEEYQSLHESSPLMKNINRWSEEGRDIPLDQTVGRAERSDQLDAIIDHMSTDLGKAMDVVSYLVMNADQAVIDKWFKGRGLLGDPGANRKDEALTGDQKEMDEDDDGDIDEDDLAAKRAKAQKVKKESLDSIRDLIQQELQNL